MGITRKEVAEMAGVSVATVSYVLNKTKHVTPEVEKRVMDAVKELGYQPNMLAKSLVTKETKHIAMLLDNMQNPYYFEVLEGVQYVAEKHGYIVSVISVNYSKREKVLEMVSRGVDGMILATGSLGITEFMKSQLPTVYDGELVRVHYRQAIFDMVEHLKAKGHRKIAFLSGLPLNNPSHVRYHDFCDAMREHGLGIDRALLVDGDGRADECAGKDAVDRLLRRNVEFTAVFAITDLMAIGVIRRLSELNKKVPSEISVVGCDGIPMGQYFSPALSTIEINGFQVGQALMKSLIVKMKPETTEYQGEWNLYGEFCDRETVSEKINKKI